MSVSSAVRRSAGVSAARERLLRLWLPSAASPEPREGPEEVAWALGDGLPETLRGGRIRVDRRAMAALLAVAVLGILIAAWFAWRGSAVVVPAQRAAVLASGVPVSGARASATGRASPTPSLATLVVDVAGKVRRPGLVTLPTGARVADALAAAGGALPGFDLASINLAALVSDGQQVVVGVAGAGGGGPGSQPGAAGGSGSGLVDLNSASLEQLESLPGVGPVLAQRILDWRTAHGSFSDVGELREVGGIGERKFADIQPKVRV